MHAILTKKMFNYNLLQTFLKTFSSIAKMEHSLSNDPLKLKTGDIINRISGDNGHQRVIGGSKDILLNVFNLFGNSENRINFVLF